jgi:hypothetical protein
MMNGSARHRSSARFLLTYRPEVSDGVGEDETWRGWVARIPEPGEPVTVGRPQVRWFASLDALPALIRELLEVALKPGPVRFDHSEES